MKSVRELVDLSGKKALVTGGAGHVAQAVEEVLVELGVKLAISDVDLLSCEQRAKILSRLGSDPVVALKADLSEESALRQMVRLAVEKLEGLDILIHCAGYIGSAAIPGWAVPFEEQDLQAWDAGMRVNVTAAFLLVQEARQALARCGHGRVIFLASIYGIVGPDFRMYENTQMGNPAGYAASKGGLIQLTRYLATLLAPGVRVNCISPGGIWRHQPGAFSDAYVARTPLRRMATEEDLKGAVAYLASDLSMYVTGHNLVVDGGFTAW